MPCGGDDVEAQWLGGLSQAVRYSAAGSSVTSVGAYGRLVHMETAPFLSPSLPTLHDWFYPKLGLDLMCVYFTLFTPVFRRIVSHEDIYQMDIHVVISRLSSFCMPAHTLPKPLLADDDD